MKALAPLALFLFFFLCTAAPAQTTMEEWKAKAVEKYPDLGVADSPLNQRFVEAYRQRSAKEPEFFKDPRWPMRLADELAGDAPAAPAPAAPAEAQGAPYPGLSTGIPVKFTAGLVASGRKDTATYNKEFAKQNKMSTSSQTLEMKVVPEGFYDGTATVAVEWFFIAKDMRSKRMVVYGEGGQKTVCNRRTPAVIRAVAGTESRDQITTTSKKRISATTTLIRGVKEFGGTSYVGWVVRAFDANGRIMGTAASVPEMLKYLSEIPLP